MCTRQWQLAARGEGSDRIPDGRAMVFEQQLKQTQGTDAGSWEPACDKAKAMSVAIRGAIGAPNAQTSHGGETVLRR